MHVYRAGNAVSTNENLYTPFYPIDWGPHHKTLGISASRASKVSREIFHRGVKFYFRAFVRPDYRFRPHSAQRRGPRPVAELLGDSQIKSCLADKWNRIDFRYWETCMSDRKSRAGLHSGGSRSVPSPSIALGPRSTQSAITTLALYNPCVRPSPLCAATSLVSYAISTCSLFPRHLLRIFVCHKGFLVHSPVWTYAKRYTGSTIRSTFVHLRLWKRRSITWVHIFFHLHSSFAYYKKWHRDISELVQSNKYV